jgi:hypothetical protein
MSLTQMPLYYSEWGCQQIEEIWSRMLYLLIRTNFVSGGVGRYILQSMLGRFR